MSFLYKIQAYHFLLCFSLFSSYIAFFKIQIKGLCQPYIKQVYWNHFSNSICLLGLSLLIIFFAAKNGEALYSQQKQD